MGIPNTIRILCALQQSCSYHTPEILPVCDYYHNTLNLALVSLSMKPWGCPYGIGKFSLKFRS
jgi:hypothetical protein